MGNKFVKQIPNIITSIRLAGAVALFFLTPLEPPWFIVYGCCGATDFLDGFLARKLHASSTIGSILDSAGDLIFYAAMLVKIVPIIWELLPLHIWIMIFVAIGLQLAGYLICAAKYHRFSSVHTWLNKATSWLVFFLPFFFIGMIPELYLTYCHIGSIFVLIPGLEICFIHIFSSQYNERNKTIFHLIRNEKRLKEEKAKAEGKAEEAPEENVEESENPESPQ